MPIIVHVNMAILEVIVRMVCINKQRFDQRNLET